MRCIKQQLPQAEVHFATKKDFHSIVQHNPYIDKVHLLETSLTAFVKQLKQEQFDYVIDLHHNTRTWLIKLQLGVKAWSFNKLNFEKWLLVTFKINRLPQQHIVDRYLQTCAPLGVTNDGQGLDYFIGSNDVVDTGSLPPGFNNGYVAWVIGAKQNTKKFPAAKIVKAISGQRWPVVLLGGKEDAAEGDSIAAQTTGGVPVFNAAGKYSLNQSASLVQQAALVFTNDTGLMHIAAAFKRPVISIWGNTIPQFGMYPYMGDKQVTNVRMEVPDLPCRPCSKLGFDACPRGHFKCMNLIDEKEIVARFERAIGQAL